MITIGNRVNRVREVVIAIIFLFVILSNKMSKLKKNFDRNILPVRKLTKTINNLMNKLKIMCNFIKKYKNIIDNKKNGLGNLESEKRLLVNSSRFFFFIVNNIFL